MAIRDRAPLAHALDPLPAASDVRRRVSQSLSLRWWQLCLLVLCLCGAQAHAAGPLVLTGPLAGPAVGPHFAYAFDPQRHYKVDDFIGPQGLAMQPLPGLVPDFGFTPARIWLRLALRNEGQAQDWRFVVDGNFPNSITVYRIAPDGTVKTPLALSPDSPFAARPVPTPMIAAPFALAPGEAATLLVAYSMPGSSRLSMSLQTEDSYWALARRENAKNYVFYGMMLVIIVLAGAALAVLRRPIFAIYAGFVASTTLYIVYADGAGFQYLWPEAPHFNAVAGIVFGSGIHVFGGLFAISYLQTARWHPVLHRVLLAVVGVVLANALLLCPIDGLRGRQVLVLLCLVCVLAYFGASLVAARQRWREVRFYTAAWFFAVISGLLFTARFTWGWETTHISTYDATRATLAIDVLMMGLAIVDRYAYQQRASRRESLDQARHHAQLGQRLALLEERYAQVVALAQRREQSMQGAVHDLRQPMQALRQALGQVLGSHAGPASDVRDVRQIESALGDMERLVAERLAIHGGTAAAARGPQDVPIPG